MLQISFILYDYKIFAYFALLWHFLNQQRGKGRAAGEEIEEKAGEEVEGEGKEEFKEEAAEEV